MLRVAPPRKDVARSRRAGRATESFPRRVAPMLATLSTLPTDSQNWAFEYKWDGVRAITYWDGSALRMESRNLIEMTRRYPDLAGLGKALGKKPMVIDGEIIALDKRGRPSFPLLSRRFHVEDPPASLVREIPVYYVVFDILYADGKWLGNEGLTERRTRLEATGLADEHWQITASHVGEGAAMLKAATEHAMEGVVAKRLDSIYEPGRRSPAWRKIKVIQRQELVIGGWLPEKGNPASGRIGALLMGYHDGGKKLRFAGAVGSGFNAAEHERLNRALRQIAREGSPFAEKTPKGATFVEPKLVAEIEYRRWPEGGMIQQAAYKGLRMDKDANSVVKETASSGQ